MNKRYIGKEKENRQVENDDEFFYNYTINDGDTLYDIAQKNNIDVSLLAEINGINVYDYLYPNQEIIIPTNDTKIYITKQDDTLQEIALKSNKSIDEIIKSNLNLYLLPDQLIVYKE